MIVPMYITLVRHQGFLSILKVLTKLAMPIGFCGEKHLTVLIVEIGLT
jgi:hypothetical protein